MGALWSLFTPADFQIPSPTQRGVDLSATDPVNAETLGDIYTPAQSADGGPSAVVVHGGSFLFGNRSMKPVQFLISRLLERGITVCSVDYRHLSRGGRLATSITDVRAALNGWVTRSSQFNCDDRHVGMVGISAGATIGLLAAGSQGAPPLSCAVSFYGLYDMTGLNGAFAQYLPRWLTQTRAPEVWRARSPIEEGHPLCPTLLIHGTDDGLVPVVQAEAMAQKRAALSLPTEQLIYNAAPHSFLNSPCTERISAVDATADFILEAMCQTN